MSVRLCFLALLVVAGSTTSASARTSGPEPPQVLALRADNVLVAIRGHEVRRVASFGHERSSLQLARGQLIVVVGRVAAVLVPRAKPLGDEVAVVNVSSLTVTSRAAAPRGVSFRAMAFDRLRRDLLLAGNRESDHEVVVARLRLGAGKVRDLRIIRHSVRGDFRVNAVSVAQDGASAVVAYHGTNTTGADTFKLPGWRRCRVRNARAGCLADAHGEAIALGDEVLATTGTPPAVAVFRQQREVAKIGLQPSAHVTSLAVEPTATVAWVPGACDAPRGIWRVDLLRRRAIWYFSGLPTLRVPTPPCGYTIELSADSRWAVTTETALPVPDAERSGAIWIFGTAGTNRQRLIRIPIPSDPVEAIFVR